MNLNKLNKWADLLLDTGKRNNLINFKDSKANTVEVILPDFLTVFNKVDHGTTFEVYNPKTDNKKEDDFDDLKSDDKSKDTFVSKEKYLEKYASKIKKAGQILVYNSSGKPIAALNMVNKKAKSAIEETGVNIAYIAFGFINWTESENSQIILHAPILLAPITIKNESVIDPYYVKVADDELILNPTFAYKMQAEFGIKLPEYEDGMDVEQYFSSIEQLISKLKWTVTKECKIGLFSFLKINMHQDLKENAKTVLNNENVKALLGESDSNNDAYVQGDEVKPQSSSEEALLNLHNVVDADSSQMEAIIMAKNNKSFVLQGPPGTGKSQTITNIIAECLANGKKVLFVSEKLAALNVVYNKLKGVGLEEFCLELHSHKANKKDVINELCTTLKKQKTAINERANKEFEAKKQAINQLDEYANELHKVRDVINKSLYQLFEEVSACRTSPDVEFVINNVQQKGEDYADKVLTALNHYVGYLNTIGSDYRANVWYGYQNQDTSYQTVAQLKTHLTDAINLLSTLKFINANLNKQYQITAQNLSQAYALYDFFKLVKDSKYISPISLNKNTFNEVYENIKTMQTAAKQILEKKASIDELFDKDIYSLDGNDLYKKLSKQFKGLFSRLFSKDYKEIVNKLRLSKKDGKKPKYKLSLQVTENLSVYQQNLLEFNQLLEKNRLYLTDAFNGIETDFNQVVNEYEVLSKVIQSDVDFGSIVNLTNEQFKNNKLTFTKFYNDFNDSFSKYSNSESKLATDFDPKEYDVRIAKLDELTAKFKGCLDSTGKLNNWIEFMKLLKELDTLEVREFVNYMVEHKFKPTSIALAFKKAFYSQWVEAILNDVSIFTSLSRIPHDELVETFKQKDVINFEVNKSKIKAKLSVERPNYELLAKGSAVSILLREGEKKRKLKPIRTLLTEIKDLALTLKPCFLMSPLSVSTYLTADMKFDVVVFDEASQIFPQDAVGAIYRGKQLIVVGDSKQMPPSNFFNTMSTSDEELDEEDDVTDFESILDICSASFPQRRLKWHYRSRYEQLISFSNKNFYDNDLVTFPSSVKDGVGVGVDFIYVNGVFDRKSRTNRKEAEKIVELVWKNIEKYPNRSLGVVAFSMSQQNLIDRLISKKRQEDPSKELFFKSDKEEPFFVKNLETVQGDERDIIIFSVAYAKDASGKLLLNFGPVNREGGERRLNVAVTRAKHNVQLVASMHHTDIDISRTNSVGARLLKEYLDYAENGQIALQRSTTVSQFEQHDSEFEKEVYDFLTKNGYKLDTQVGCSSFKIDLALKHPNTSNYVLAIECDGATYHSSKNARDRDRLRQQILERMGWKFYRIWSTDWFRNKDVEKELLLTAVKNALANKPVKEVKPKVEEASSESETEVSFEQTVDTKQFEFPKYNLVNAKSIARSYRNNFYNTLIDIMKAEAPISEEWLLKRIVFLFGKEKVTSTVKEQYKMALSRCSQIGIIRANGFLYLSNTPVPMLRVQNPKDAYIREIKHIAFEELANGMREIIKQNIRVEKAGLYQTVAKVLGFTRASETTIKHLDVALHLLQNEVSVEGNIITLKS